MSPLGGYFFRVALGGLAVRALISCKNVEAPPTPANIGGTWSYTEALTESVFGISCADTGTYSFTQDGAKFGGNYVQTGKCRSGGSVAFNTGHGPVTNGSVTTIRVQFTADSLCSYTGLLSNARDAVAQGTGLCDFI